MMKEPINIRVGNNIRKERLKKNLSQESLAEMANVHRTYIGIVERAERNITLVSLEKIAKALNVNIAELFNE
jgi:transcriptional regulator with XRE-family HTH domain